MILKAKERMTEKIVLATKYLSFRIDFVVTHFPISVENNKHITSGQVR